MPPFALWMMRAMHDQPCDAIAALSSVVRRRAGVAAPDRDTADRPLVKTAALRDAPGMVTQGLILLTVAVTAGAPMEPGSEQAHLGVTATVVRPAEIVAFPAEMKGAVALIRNSASIDVVADGGTVRQLGEETKAVTSDRADLVTITLVF